MKTKKSPFRLLFPAAFPAVVACDFRNGGTRTGKFKNKFHFRKIRQAKGLNHGRLFG